MTKVAAIVRVMQDQGGTATLQDIYQDIEKYYPVETRTVYRRNRPYSILTDMAKAGIRGVLYRDVGKTFKKVGEATYSLI